jgi:hypothetical protein
MVSAGSLYAATPTYHESSARAVVFPLADSCYQPPNSPDGVRSVKPGKPCGVSVRLGATASEVGRAAQCRYGKPPAIYPVCCVH